MKTTTLCIRVDPELKKEAEGVLSDLGLSLSTAVTLMLKQIVIRNELPFEISNNIPGILHAEEMTREELMNEISGAAAVREPKGMTLSEYLKDFEQRYGKWKNTP